MTTQPFLEALPIHLGKGRDGHDHKPTHFLGKEWAIMFIDTLPRLKKRGGHHGHRHLTSLG